MLVHANILNSEIEPFIAVTRDNFEHEENCKLQSLTTIRILHRPRGGGQEDKRGDWLGSSTTEEDGEDDKAGETVEEFSGDWQGGEVGLEVGKGDQRRQEWSDGGEG